MKRYLNLNDRAFNAIKNKTKRVEIRANAGKEDYDKYNIGDIIVFKNSKNETINCRIKEINKYDSVVNSLNGYKQAIKENGVYAIHIEYLYSNENVWQEMYDKALERTKMCQLNEKFLDAGGVGAAILSSNENIYTGVCIDTSCSLGMCAERNAISTMITAGEYEIKKVVCTDDQGALMMPCGACMEYMMQLSNGKGEIEILKNIETKETVKLKELIPVWWGVKCL